MRTDLDQVLPIWLGCFNRLQCLLLLSSCKLCTDVTSMIWDFDVLTYSWPVDCLSSPEVHFINCIVSQVQDLEGWSSFRLGHDQSDSFVWHLHMWFHLWNTSIIVYCGDSLWSFWATPHVLSLSVTSVLDPLMWPHIFLVVSLDLLVQSVWSGGLEFSLCCSEWCCSLVVPVSRVLPWKVHLLWHFLYLGGILCAHDIEPVWGAVLNLKLL